MIFDKGDTELFLLGWDWYPIRIYSAVCVCMCVRAHTRTHAS